MVIYNVVLQEVEVNEAQLEDKSVRTLFKWMKSGEKPVKLSKDGSDRYIYGYNFKNFRVFGKNVYRCYDKSGYGVHFQYVEPTSDDLFQPQYKRQLLPRKITLKTSRVFLTNEFFRLLGSLWLKIIRSFSLKSRKILFLISNFVIKI
ncbi:hypothetical protein BpHYR1_001523 [Brachionus plicatilis]|uniref:Uncharacterized protein n=1 Tax=Brachionus plicatilis TaxID=10195 RepID=A0A3M7Q7G8_BRAPC|nr:hypothetical protein BpHYR1_001523 [Brachionus plicatilis]